MSDIITKNPKVEFEYIDHHNRPHTATVPFVYQEGYMFRGTRKGKKGPPPKYREDWVKDERSPYNEGHNGHLIGTWWPYMICAMRDMAHAHLRHGICGQEGRGATSIVLNNGSKTGYENVDNGDEIKYCGDGNTLLDASMKNGMLIRVLRAANPHSNWAPLVGWRYDGLYRVVRKEKIPEKEGYWYILDRVDDQKPISRVHPTPQELAEYQEYNR
ncbi:uncharacterized protein EAF01_002123 [Botrytis porri]|uniref:YDG domain-containing protein n=1 Tax=Botrytis porri TaxID=87229 RepID=A0A4Z1L601_9HELO|nr:uncharacterized protein EAF01_002123 [Botrytis porri]KAF7910613.1 hypothetical protein EAF01_002123 [Botrytis porri]TGO92290.1 hypothetical protein BPOR_0006g00300 [Botrytis porri]